MIVVISLDDAKKLLAEALKFSIGHQSYEVVKVEWESYLNKVTFTLDPVVPEPPSDGTFKELTDFREPFVDIVPPEA